MKKQVIGVMALIMVLLYSCKSFNDREKDFETDDGISKIASSLDNEFGKNASYTDVTLSYAKGIGTTISATGTKDPTSVKLLSKQKVNGSWQNVSEVTLEIDGDARPADFMFTLNDVQNLKKVPEMIKTSIEKIKKEKNFDVVAEHVSVKAPERINSADDKPEYNINLRPETGGTSFIMIFDSQGNFQKMVY
jgi:hypothetical protein